VKAVGINFQVPAGRKSTWREHLKRCCGQIANLAEGLEWTPVLLAVGIIEPLEAAMLAKTGFSVRVINGEAYHAARNFQQVEVSESGVDRSDRPRGDKDELFERNLRVLDDAYGDALQAHH